MAEKKINITELANLIAERCSIPGSAAKRYLISLNTAIRNALNSDEIVKISGLGTFKVITTEPRKSVDVNTGAEITIGSYRKVTFTPEISVKTLLNRQFEELPVIEVDDDYQLKNNNNKEITDDAKPETDDDSSINTDENDVKLASDETIDEIKQLLAAINGEAGHETSAAEGKEHTNEQKTAETGITSIAAPVEDDTMPARLDDDNASDIKADATAVHVMDESAREDKAENDKHNEANESVQSENIIGKNETEKATTTENNNTGKIEKKENKISFWKIALLMIVIFSVIFGLFYFLLIRHIDKWTKEYVQPAQEAVENEIKQRNSTDITQADDIIQTTPQEDTTKIMMAEEQGTNEITNEKPVHDDASIAVNATARTTETVIEGSRLSQISRRHYGHPDFWIYIYLANKEKFPHGPNSVVTGTNLIIPDMPSEMIDPKSDDALERARALQESL